MEGTYHKIGLILLAVILLTSCSKDKPEDSFYFDTSILKDGDIVCRLGSGMFSNLFKNYSVHEKRYSHVGVIYKDKDAIYVIHAEASDYTGVGFVKKEELSSFLKKAKAFGAYRIQNIDDSINKQISLNALKYHLKKTPFDTNFDLSNDDTVYCSQMVANSINQALEKDYIQPGITIKNRPFYTIDDIYYRPEIATIILKYF